MRDVLYRAKPKNLSAYVDAVWEQIAWVYGSPLVNRCNGLSVQIFEQRNGKLYNWECDPETLGQWTGLTDKNGRKIFEGDIIQDGYEENDWVVKFFDAMFWGVDANGIYSDEELAELADLIPDGFKGVEVVGNIHDNPELLEDSAV